MILKPPEPRFVSSWRRTTSRAGSRHICKQRCREARKCSDSKQRHRHTYWRTVGSWKVLYAHVLADGSSCKVLYAHVLADGSSWKVLYAHVLADGSSCKVLYAYVLAVCSSCKVLYAHILGDGSSCKVLYAHLLTDGRFMQDSVYIYPYCSIRIGKISDSSERHRIVVLCVHFLTCCSCAHLIYLQVSCCGFTCSCSEAKRTRQIAWHRLWNVSLFLRNVSRDIHTQFQILMACISGHVVNIFCTMT
jgi:hypothetical protein